MARFQSCVRLRTSTKSTCRRQRARHGTAVEDNRDKQMVLRKFRNQFEQRIEELGRWSLPRKEPKRASASSSVET